MADEDSQEVEINTDVLRYRCSNCGLERPSAYGVQRHIAQTDACKAAEAFTRMIVPGKIENAVQAQPDNNDDDEGEIAVIQSLSGVPLDSGSSMAQQAARLPMPSWAEPSDDEVVLERPNLPERDIEPLGIRSPLASYTITPKDWLYVAYSAALRDGYSDTMTEWVHDMIAQMFVLLGIKIEIFNVPVEFRMKELQKVGLLNG